MSFLALKKLTSRQDEGVPLLAFATDSESREILGEVATRQQWSPGAIHKGGVVEAVGMLSQMKAPSHLVIDISGLDDPLAAINQLAEVCEPGTVVVAVGTQNDITLYRGLIEAGVSDYLVKPLDVEALEQALLQPVAADEAPAAASGPDLTFVIGVRGGVGATTVAVNVSWVIGQEQKRKASLVDLDLQFGGISLALDLEPGRGLREALQNPGRIDGLFLERSLVKATDNLSVLSAEDGVDQDAHFDSEAVRLLVAELGSSTKHIVADMPRASVSHLREALALAQRVILVTDLSLGGLRDTVRLRKFIGEVAPEAKIAVVANRVAPKVGMSKIEFERGLEGTIDIILPDDPKSVTTAINAGKPIAQMAERTKLVSELRNLALWITGAREAPRPAPLWRRMVAKK